MTTTNPATDERDWLTAAAAPGRGALRAAAACQVLDTAFTVVQWTALAWLAEDLLTRGARAIPGWPPLSMLAAGGLLAAAAAWVAVRFQATGRRRISSAIRHDLVAGSLAAGRRLTDPHPAAAALATVELVDDVADYHAEALPRHVSAPLSMVLIVLVTAVVQWPAAVILLPASLILVPNLRLAGQFAKEGADAQLAATNRLAAVILDSFRGMRTLQNLAASGRRRTTLAEAADRLNAATMATMRRAFLSSAVMEVVITYSVAVNAAYIGLSLLGYLHPPGFPQMTLFNGLTVLLLCPMYFAPLRAIAAAYHTRERAAAAVPTMTALLDDAPAVPDRRPAPTPRGPVTVTIDEASIRFHDSPEPILHDVNLTVPAGQWVTVTGPSGAGKTTLLSLIAGVRAPSTGSVHWLTPNGAVTPLLGGCTWIGQRTVILPGTIADNIRLGRPDANRTEIEQAAATAGLTDIAARLPDGLDTQLGEDGRGLSTGETRRIAIARALLRDAELWILDEPTAHLDPDAEAEVINALGAAAHRRTVIIATHSAPLARAADTMLVISDGTLHPSRTAIAA